MSPLAAEKMVKINEDSRGKPDNNLSVFPRAGRPVECGFVGADAAMAREGDATSPLGAAGPSASRRSGRLERIDVLRACAAISVVIYHHLGSFFGWYVPWRDGFRDFSGGMAHASALHGLSFGWVGVPLFFVLSGFCIHAGFVHRRRFNLGTFCWRRFWRIYPPYLVAVLVFALWPIDWLSTSLGPRAVITNGLMVQNLMADDFWSKLNPSFWSVPTEFQCYLLYPVFLLLGKFWGTSRVALGWFACACVGKILVGASEGWPEHAIDYGLCFPLLTFGDWALGAYVAEKLAATERPAWLSSVPVFVLTGGLFLASMLWRPGISLAFSLAAACGALLVFNYAARETRPNLIERALGLVGLASYSLYLWHQPLLGPLTELGRNLASDLPLNAARIATLLTIGGGLAVVTFCSYWLLERPSMAIAAKRSWPLRLGQPLDFFQRSVANYAERVKLRLQRPNPMRN
jgi:peptidoglycan/LPS O-acetylase OafA/YrhL